VVVLANGISYKGILVEVTEDTVTLRTETGWVSVPGGIRPLDLMKKARPRRRRALKYMIRVFSVK